MKPTEIDNTALAEMLGQALVLIGADPDDAKVYWVHEDSDDYVVHVAAAFGLLRYRYAEMPASMNWELALEQLTPWSEVDADVKTVTRHQSGPAFWSSIELKAKGMKVETSTGRKDQGFLEFLAEVIRRSSKATL